MKSVFYFICVHSNQCKTCVCVLSLYVTGVVYMCVDLDECVEGQHQCQQRCINTFGSFQCSCVDGYQPAHDQTSCTGVYVCAWSSVITSQSVNVFNIYEQSVFVYVIHHLSRCGRVPAACSCNRLRVRLC